MENKLVVLGVPWDVDTDGLRDYMSKFGQLDDCVVMKERSSGRSRGFGYVTFSSVEDAKKVLSSDHSLGNRSLEVKVATPKEDMKSPARKVTRIFVARIPSSVTEIEFRSHFGSYGEITDLYMPKDPTTKVHRGIGFVTFSTTDPVEHLMMETHELGGTTVVVDRATPKEEDFRPMNRITGGGYGVYSAYVNAAATRYAALGAPTLYDHASLYAREPPAVSALPGARVSAPGKKIFIGRLPQEANTEDLRQYFGKFGRILDAYIPKDPKRVGHRGFGFVTFAEDGVAERVAHRPHEICGHQVAIDSATPLDETSGAPRAALESVVDPQVQQQQAAAVAAVAAAQAAAAASAPFGAAGYGHGPTRATGGRMYGGAMEFEDWGFGVGGATAATAAAAGRPARADWRYRPY